MNAFVAKEEIALLMPNRLSHYFQDDAIYTPGPERKPAGLFTRIATFFRMVAEMPRRAAILQELSALSDHELADIGLVRADLARVFDLDFFERRNAERKAAGTARA